MQKGKATKIGVIIAVMVFVSFTCVMYALAYSLKTEVLYSQTFTIDGKGQKFCPFYLSSPAVTFEVKLSVSEGSIKWTPYSAVLFENTFGSVSSETGEISPDAIYGWECETENGIVKWRVDAENLDQVWYLTFLNEDLYEKEVFVEVTKVWSDQNYHDWM
jgi:hypothetical protein